MRDLLDRLDGWRDEQIELLARLVNHDSGTFKPADETATPPQSHDAKCGFACHTVVKARDYVFTEYAQR